VRGIMPVSGLLFRFGLAFFGWDGLGWVGIGVFFRLLLRYCVEPFVFERGEAGGLRGWIVGLQDRG